MKYLKLFEATDILEVEQTIKEICLELEDEGFEITLNNIFTGGRISVPLTLNMSLLRHSNMGLRTFIYDEVSEVIERIRDYMRTQGYATYVNKKYAFKDPSINKFKSDPLLDVYISFLEIPKHIRKFNESIDQAISDEVKSDLKDICLDLSDEGFTVNIKGIIPPSKDRIFQGTILGSVKILKIRERTFEPFRSKFHEFKYSDVQEYIERIKDYLTPLGYDITIYVIESKGEGEVKWILFESDIEILRAIYLRIT